MTDSIEVQPPFIFTAVCEASGEMRSYHFGIDVKGVISLLEALLSEYRGYDEEEVDTTLRYESTDGR